MEFEYITIVDVKADNGIIFLSVKHKLSNILLFTFLSPQLFQTLNILNKENFEKNLNKYLEEVNKDGEKILKDTILLQFQRDLIKIYKEFV